MILADTDVLIDALKGREPSRLRIERELLAGNLATTSITAFELLSGVRSVAEQEKVEALLAPLDLFPFDGSASRVAAEVKRTLDRSGQGLAMADLQIAGICLAHSFSLLTRNRAHFERVPGLLLA